MYKLGQHNDRVNKVDFIWLLFVFEQNLDNLQNGSLEVGQPLG